jgi:hypothetical protein
MNDRNKTTLLLGALSLTMLSPLAMVLVGCQIPMFQNLGFERNSIPSPIAWILATGALYICTCNDQCCHRTVADVVCSLRGVAHQTSACGRLAPRIHSWRSPSAKCLTQTVGTTRSIPRRYLFGSTCQSFGDDRQQRFHRFRCMALSRTYDMEVVFVY